MFSFFPPQRTATSSLAELNAIQSAPQSRSQPSPSSTQQSRTPSPSQQDIQYVKKNEFAAALMKELPKSSVWCVDGGMCSLPAKLGVDFASGVANKKQNSGTISYGKWTPDTLEIVGGTTDKNGNRRVKVWEVLESDHLEANKSLAIKGKGSFMEFGVGENKAVSAGKIAYQGWSSGLDIVGAGSTNGNRRVSVWDNLDVKNNVNVSKKLYFGDTSMTTNITNENNSDPYSLEKVVVGGNQSSLRMTINDDPDESFQIWGNSCAAGDCAGPGRMAHKFDATGDASHTGSLNVGNKLFFGDASLSTRPNNTNRSDPYYLEKVVSENNTSLRLTINDDPDESFQIWGNSCAAGDCAGPGRMAHKFDATGDVRHSGSLTVDGNGVNFTKSDVGPMIEKRYSSAGDRYGVGQFQNGQMRMYTAKTYGPASLSLSYANENGGFDDVLKITQNNGNYSSRFNGNICIGNTCINEDHLKKLIQPQ